MRRRLQRPPRATALLVATIAAVAALAAGCAGTPDRYYTLAAAPGADAALQQAPTRAPTVPMFIELAPVGVPERLARPQLLVHPPGQATGRPGSVALLEQHRWTSSFEQELRDALAAGIAARLGAVNLTRGGRQPGMPVWRIAVQVRQFDLLENDRVSAAFSWTARRADAEQRSTCEWSASEPAGPGIDALAAQAQRVTAALAAAMARHLAALQSRADAACPG